MDTRELVDQAAQRAGSRAKLARALGVPPPNVTQWANGSRPCPDEKVIAMARIAGLPPKQTFMEVAWSRLGKLATTSALGAVAMLSAFGIRPGDALAAEPRLSEHYV